MIMFDVAQVFRAFGGPAGLLSRLDQHTPGHKINYGTIAMWSQRGAIPTKQIGAVLHVIDREGYGIQAFLVDRRTKDDDLADLGLVPRHARSRG